MIPSEIVAAIRRIEIRASRVVNSMVAGEYHSAFKGQGLNFAEVREYAIGDDVRQIDWNVTAKAGKPHIKLFNEERELTVVILADLSGSGQFGSTTFTKREVIAELTAILGLSALSNNDRVGALLFTDEIEALIPVKKGRSHVLRLVRDVLAIEPRSRRTSIDTVLRYLLRFQRRSAIVFLISDFIDSGYENALALASAQYDVVPIVVQDPGEARIPESGLIQGVDPETGQTVIINTSDSTVRNEIISRRNARHIQLTKLFQKYNLIPINVEVGKSYVDSLVRFFTARGRF
ncbi:DUF58 domain-containing protein [bacterium]|nr:DUF58 domain-containing protein [bacterium]